MAGNTDTTQQSPDCDDSVDTDRTAPAALTQALRNMHEWIYSDASQNLHHAAPLDEFTDKLMVRLQEVLTRYPAWCPRTAITKSVCDLVHDLNRTAIRREARFLTRPAFDDLIDQGGNVERRLVEDAQQAEAMALLSRLKDKDRELVEQVYGLQGCEVNREQIAVERGVLRTASINSCEDFQIHPGCCWDIILGWTKRRFPMTNSRSFMAFCNKRLLRRIPTQNERGVLVPKY